MINTFIYSGADMTLKSDNGKTPLDLATELLSEGNTKRFKRKRG